MVTETMVPQILPWALGKGTPASRSMALLVLLDLTQAALRLLDSSLASASNPLQPVAHDIVSAARKITKPISGERASCVRALAQHNIDRRLPDR